MANLAGWPYWKVVSITGQAGSGTDYQVELEIGDSAGGDFHLEGHCTNFPQDIRITDDDGTTLLDHFVEDLTADPIVVQIEVKDDLGSNQTIRVYYGKSGETTASNIDATMVFGDDFSSGYDTVANWTTVVGTPTVTGGVLTVLRAGGVNEEARSQTQVGVNHAIRARVKIDYTNSGAHITQFGFSDVTTDVNHGVSGDNAFVYPLNLNFNNFNVNDGSNTGGDTTDNYDNSAYHIFDIYRNGSTNCIYKLDGTLFTAYNTIADNVPDANMGAFFKARSNDGSQLDVDWIAIRKYNSPEPAFSSAGAEQTPGWTGTILGVTNPAKVIGIDVSNIAKVMNI